MCCVANDAGRDFNCAPKVCVEIHCSCAGDQCATQNESDILPPPTTRQSVGYSGRAPLHSRVIPECLDSTGARRPVLLGLSPAASRRSHVLAHSSHGNLNLRCGRSHIGLARIAPPISVTSEAGRCRFSDPRRRSGHQSACQWSAGSEPSWLDAQLPRLARLLTLRAYDQRVIVRAMRLTLLTRRVERRLRRERTIILSRRNSSSARGAMQPVWVTANLAQIGERDPKPPV